MKFYTIICLAFFIFIIWPHSADAEVELTQTYIDSRMSLFAKDGPYLIPQDVYVPKEKDLAIEMGTILKFTGGQIRVAGTLNLLGSSTKPISIEMGNGGGLNSVFNITGGRLNGQFVKVRGGERSLIESVEGNIQLIHSHFENIQTRKSLVVSYASSSIYLSDDSFSEIRAPHVLELYNGSSASISESSFIKSGQYSAVSIFDAVGQIRKSLVTISDSAFRQSLTRAIEVFSGAALVLDRVSIADSHASGLLAHTNSSIEIKNSSFERNDIAIESYNSNATSTNNIFEGNKSQGIISYGSIFIASNNWWGSPSGPYNEQRNIYGTGQSVSENVIFEPWLKTKPLITNCCSSILFIPGIEGSRLYTKNILENQLWEPNSNSDVKKLFLDINGKSKLNNVYTRDIIGKTNLTGALLGIDIYQGFTDFMRGLVSEGTISSWKAFPYDWRLSTDEVSKKIINLEKGTTTLESAFDLLAKSSKTGKVTIVAHSNGGLVAKNFLRNLINSGRANLVDQLVLVAVPEYGTPQAVADMLHGDSQSILGGLVLSKSTARDLAINMPSVYGLLPSRKLFENLYQPLISFNSGSQQSIKYGLELSSSNQIAEFLLASKGDRGAAKNTDEPIVLNSALLKKSEMLHQNIDGMFFNTALSSPLQVTSIVGVGNETLSGITYNFNKKGKNINVERSRVISNLGDGVVLAGESASRSGDVYVVDLKSLSIYEGKNYKHSNILNASSTQQMILSLVKKNMSTLPLFMSKEATSTNNWKRYEFTVHSPVSIMAHSLDGKRTGLLKAPDGDEIGISIEEIPGSQYVNFGEAKTIITPTPPTKIELKGLDTGTFRFTASEFIEDQIVNKIEYSNVPTIEGMSAVFVPASSSVMSIDYNSDNINDQELLPDSQSPDLNLSNEIAKAKNYIITHAESRLIRDKYIKDLDGILKLVQKGNLEKAALDLNRISDQLASALKIYNLIQKGLKIKKLVAPIVRDTSMLYFQFQKLSSVAAALAE